MSGLCKAVKASGNPESANQHPEIRLVADIGGTNARFALLMPTGELAKLRVLVCEDYPDIVAAVKAYLEQVGQPVIREAAFAIANPIVGDQVQMTNHRWNFSIAEARQSLGLDRLIFKNDFTALAMSIPVLPTSDLSQHGGQANDHPMPIAVIGAGTGLGVSGLLPVDGKWYPLEGEGGHVSLSPSNERECAIMLCCQQWYEHVSAERLVSGPGLQNLHRAICCLDKVACEALSPEDISRRGMDGSDACCVEAFNIFCALLGGITGDLVLTLGAFGGVYIGGGIAPHIGTYLHKTAFRQRFESKGRMRALLETTPAYVIKTAHPTLRGVSQVFSAESDTDDSVV